MKSSAFFLTVAGIAAMVVAIVIGPAVSHPAYDSIRHSTSELAGRNMPGAWLMRGGFALFGASVAVAATLRARANPARTAALVGFGIGMIAAAFWHHDPIDPALGSNAIDDQRHSIAATTAGIAFTIAVLAQLAQHGWPRRDWLSWLALAASALLPAVMFIWPETAGLWQRLMFLISFAWLLRLHASPG